MDVVTILRELERAWDGSLPGRQAAELNAALRELWRIQQQQQTTRVPAHLRLARS